MNTFTTQDGFTWYVLQPKVAKYLHEANYEVYELHDDESESLCEDGHDFSDDSVRYGIETPLDSQIVHALCGAELVNVYEIVRDFEVCYEIIFEKRRGDLVFFSPLAKPKAVLDNLRGCDAVTFITSEDFLRILRHG
jgi:hypothetical protein